MYNKNLQNHYLNADVHTATPQKLQLMLVEAAIKNIHRAKIAWKEEKFDVGFETLSRAQDIIAEILCSLDVKGNPQIAKQLASIYLFVFRNLAEGGMTFEVQKLDDALRVLNSERETWRQVCEKFGSSYEETEKAGDSIKLDSNSVPCPALPSKSVGIQTNAALSSTPSQASSGGWDA